MTSATKAFGAVMAVSLLASLASVPFGVRVRKQSAGKETSLSESALWSIIIGFELAASTLAVATGLWAGVRVGLGAPLVLRVAAGDPTALRELRQGLPLAIAVGFGTGVAIAVLHLALRRMTPAGSKSPAGFKIWERLLAALSAGIREELWFRFGLMTCVVWGAVHIVPTTGDNPAILWSANLLVALGFGVAHLDQARALHGLTASYVAFILLLNGFASLAFGWVYWRQGLLAAIVTHSCTDLILQTLASVLDRQKSRARLTN
ncbi:MAG TPA: CPBP family glutamic-type intramembrane protease [Acidobacteriota bacterium]|jgi:hypothetical protein|nr:CPBP family glutamic-type intramembrane protease [Acidobacteriota bacterium]